MSGHIDSLPRFRGFARRTVYVVQVVEGPHPGTLVTTYFDEDGHQLWTDDPRKSPFPRNTAPGRWEGAS